MFKKRKRQSKNCFFCYNKIGDRMKKNEYEKILSIAMSTGADFAEIYYEEMKTKSYNFNDSMLDTIKTNNQKGIGIRIIKDDEYFYSSTNNLDFENLKKTAKKLAGNIVGRTVKKNIKLRDLQVLKHDIKIPHKNYAADNKKNILKSIDSKIREKYSQVTQVILRFIEDSKDFTIANTEGKFINSDSIHTRYICMVYTEKNGIKENEHAMYGEATGYEFLDNFNIESLSLSTAKSAVDKLDAEDFPGGEYPVIIASGFGAVIFHEACGHGLEATSIAPKLSIFTDLIGTKIASEKVTLIDDGTLENVWGSNIIDDEGNKTEKTVLIDKGVLKNYLIDMHSSKKMNMRANGCARRQDYNYAPTSRMSNTYLAPGNDTINEMLESIELGVYCEKLSGGTVNTTTGDFNFAVDTAHLIENGKITKPIKGITLIGNGKDILNNVEMVSDDLKLSDGYCGSKSGMVHVTIGQPTIKISKILVGGKE